MTTTPLTRVRAPEPFSTRFEWQLGIDAICAAHGVTLAQLQGVGRIRTLCDARGECYVFLRDRGWSTPKIGELFSRDHSTIMAALQSGATREKRLARQRDRCARLVLLKRDMA